MIAKNKASLNDCMDAIEEMTEKENITLTHAEDEDMLGTTLQIQGQG